MEARKDGLFTSLADFAARVNPRAINKRVIESLAAAGAFDALDSNRARVFAGAEAILAACQRSHEAATMGQNDMFGGAADAPTIMLPQVEPWLPAERLRREYDAIGFFLSGHPLDDYATVLKRLRVQSWAEFSRAVKTGATAGKVAATVVSRMERRTKTGNKMGIIGLSDPTGHFEAVLFSEGLAQYREVLEPGAAVLLQLGAELQGEDVRARVLHAEPLDDAAAKTQKGLRIFVRDTRPLESIAKRLQMPEAGQGAAARGLQAKPASAPAGGADGDVSLVMMLDLETEVEMKLPGRFKVSPQIAGRDQGGIGRGRRADAVAIDGGSDVHDGPQECAPTIRSLTAQPCSWRRREHGLVHGETSRRQGNQSAAEAAECPVTGCCARTPAARKFALRARPVAAPRFQARAGGLAGGQNPYAAILSCADLRIAPEYAFDSGRGDLFVCRVAGNFASTETIASMEYAVAVLAVPLILVLGHDSCGAVGAAIKSLKDDKPLPGHMPSLVEAIAPSVKAVWQQGGDTLNNAIRQNVIDNVAKLGSATPILNAAVEQHKLRVVGGIYRLDDGMVDMVA